MFGKIILHFLLSSLLFEMKTDEANVFLKIIAQVSIDILAKAVSFRYSNFKPGTLSKKKYVIVILFKNAFYIT